MMMMQRRLVLPVNDARAECEAQVSLPGWQAKLIGERLRLARCDDFAPGSRAECEALASMRWLLRMHPISV